MKHWKQRLHFYIAILVIMGAVSCTNDEVQIDSPTTTPDVSTEEVKLTMKVSVPDSPGTRASGMDSATEELVQEVKILAFRKEGDTRRYAYTTDGKVIGKTITANVKRSSSDTELYRFLLIVNSNKALPPFEVGERLLDVKKKIKYDCSGAWNLAHGIPMSGETADMAILDKPLSSSIILTRAMARVDVGVNYNKENNYESATGLTPDVFRLRNVRVYRSNTEGTIVDGQAVVTSPRDDTSPLIYNNTSTGNLPEGRFMNRFIYLPESEAGDFNTATCLIIGGRYSKNTSVNWSDIPETFYRVDFMEGELYKKIQRNHRYIINITNVTGAGYPTPEDALRNKPININVQIKEWNRIFNDIEFSGSNYFACEKRTINLGYKAGSAVTIKAESSIPAEQWVIESEGAAWQSKIKVAKLPDPENSNAATITFTANANGDATSDTAAETVVMKVANILVKFTVSQDSYVYGQPDEVVGGGWKPSDTEEDVLTKPKNNI